MSRNSEKIRVHKPFPGAVTLNNASVTSPAIPVGENMSIGSLNVQASGLSGSGTIKIEVLIAAEETDTFHTPTGVSDVVTAMTSSKADDSFAISLPVTGFIKIKVTETASSETSVTIKVVVQ